jgi:hypothetical protein
MGILILLEYVYSNTYQIAFLYIEQVVLLYQRIDIIE